MRSATLLTFAIFGLKALAQESSFASGDQFTIQTDPATPTSSPTGSSLSGSNTGSSASTATPASSITGAAAPASTSFPVACADSCREISQTLSQCGVGNDLDAQCLCTVQNEQNYLRCVQCALTLNPSEAAARSYQALLDAFIDQCANAPQNPTTLPNVTVTLVPTSISGSATSSPTIITGSTSPASSRSASASSSRVFSSVSLPFSSISRGPLPSSSNVAASSSASPTGAARRSVELGSGGGFLPGGMWSGLLLAGLGAVGVRLAGLA